MTTEIPIHPDAAANYDALGRKVPQRLHFMAFARGISGFAAQFSTHVPPEFVARVGHDE
jgi:hypothetical protein